jgi:hypothetical protein
MLNPPELPWLFQRYFNLVSLRTQSCRKFNLDKDNLGANSEYTVLRNNIEARGKAELHTQVASWLALSNLISQGFLIPKLGRTSATSLGKGI